MPEPVPQVTPSMVNDQTHAATVATAINANTAKNDDLEKKHEDNAAKLGPWGLILTPAGVASILALVTGIAAIVAPFIGKTPTPAPDTPQKVFITNWPDSGKPAKVLIDPALLTPEQKKAITTKEPPLLEKTP